VTHLFSKSSVICTFIFSLIVPPQFVQSLVGTFKLTSFTAREALVFKIANAKRKAIIPILLQIPLIILEISLDERTSTDSEQ
jgi:hypothetical protein